MGMGSCYRMVEGASRPKGFEFLPDGAIYCPEAKSSDDDKGAFGLSYRLSDATSKVDLALDWSVGAGKDAYLGVADTAIGLLYFPEHVSKFVTGTDTYWGENRSWKFFGEGFQKDEHFGTRSMTAFNSTVGGAVDLLTGHLPYYIFNKGLGFKIEYFRPPPETVREFFRDGTMLFALLAGPKVVRTVKARYQLPYQKTRPVVVRPKKSLPHGKELSKYLERVRRDYAQNGQAGFADIEWFRAKLLKMKQLSGITFDEVLMIVEMQKQGISGSRSLFNKIRVQDVVKFPPGRRSIALQELIKLKHEGAMTFVEVSAKSGHFNSLLVLGELLNHKGAASWAYRVLRETVAERYGEICELLETDYEVMSVRSKLEADPIIGENGLEVRPVNLTPQTGEATMLVAFHYEISELSLALSEVMIDLAKKDPIFAENLFELRGTSTLADYVLDAIESAPDIAH